MGADRKVWLGYWPKKPSGGGTAPKKAVCLSDAIVEQLTGCVAESRNLLSDNAAAMPLVINLTTKETHMQTVRSQLTTKRQYGLPPVEETQIWRSNQER